MTPDEALEAAAVLTAFANGRKIEVGNKRIPDSWNREDEPLWNFGYCEYRVAPEPWSGKIWVHKATGNVRDELHFGGIAPIEGGWQLIQAKEVEE